jgi:very-short-patch-repair endonuclease
VRGPPKKNMPHRQDPQLTENARDLRARQTEAELLLWAVIRGRRLCGLKFRRQYPIKPFIADFVCIEKKLIIEIDGGYHDYVYAEDKSRQQKIESEGWDVVRFSNEDVLGDVEAVAVAIARHLELEPVFRGRKPK